MVLLLVLILATAWQPLAIAPATVEGSGGGVPGDPRQLTPDGQFALPSVISPDGSTIVYVGRDDSGDEAVYATSTGGGPVVPLSGFVLGGDVGLAKISPDGQHVVYVADHNVAGKLELWSVPITGGSRVHLSGPMVGGGDVRLTSGLAENVDSLLFTPDSARVLYVADSAIDGAYEVFVGNVSGGPPTKLHADHSEGASVSQWELASSGTEVVYVARKSNSSRFRLFKAAIDGPPAVRLSPQEARLVDGFLLSADGMSVYWDGVNDQAGRQVLMSVPLAGGTSTQLSGTAVAGGGVWRYKETGDLEHVVYQASQEDKNISELYSAAADGSGWEKLNPTLVSGRRVTNSWDVSPTGSAVIYRADQDSDNVFETFLVDANGGEVTKLNPPLTGTLTGLGTFGPEGSHIVFSAETGPGGSKRLYRANPDTGDVKWISADIGDLHDIEGDGAYGSPPIRFTPDGRWVIYLARSSPGADLRLVASRTNGGGSRDLSAPDHGAGSYVVSDQGTHVRYNSLGILHYTTIRIHKCDGEPATHAGTPGHDTLTGTNARDVMVGFAGADTINALKGADIICGGAGNDQLDGGAGPDRIFGGQGVDRIEGFAGHDFINGNSGRDSIWGRAGNDRLLGGPGNDQLRGGANIDSLLGGLGNDRMFGGSGNDTCDGGAGEDEAASCQSSNVP